jgi:uncharacterized protein (PEP-CTERM system associated)
MRMHRFAPGALMILAGPSLGAELEPTISASLIHTDNLTLAATDLEAETVLQLSPGLRIVQDSPRLTANAAYQLDAYRYDRRGESEVYNLFDGEVTYGVVADRLFLNAGAARTLSIRNPEEPIPITNLAISSNRVERNDYYVGPSFRVSVGGNAVFSGELRRNWIEYPGEDFGAGIEAYEDDNVTLGVDNYQRRRGFTWAVRYESERTDYGQQFVPFEYRRGLVELGFWAREGTRLFAAGGEESAWDNASDPQLNDEFWEVGFAHQVTEKLRAEFAVGDRTFGSSRRGSLQYDFDRGQISFDYTEAPRNEASTRYARGALLSSAEPNDYLVRVGTLERYISKRGQWGVDYERERTGFSLMLYDEERVQRTRPDGTPLPDESQHGIDLEVSWEVGARTRLIVRGEEVTREFVVDQEIALADTSIGVVYELGRRTELTLSVASWRERADPPALGRNYRAKVVALTFGRTF